jgi:hypothetical protein
MAVNCVLMRLNSSWMAVLFPTNVTAILRSVGGMSQTAVLTLFGIHSTKYWLFLLCGATNNRVSSVPRRPMGNQIAHSSIKMQ